MSTDSRELTGKKLGFSSHALLSVAALTKGIAGIVKEDSRRSKFALLVYVTLIALIAPACFLLMVIPGPNILGILLALSSAFLFAGTVKALSLTGLSAWARLRDEKYLRGIVSREALVRKFNRYLAPKAGKPQELRVRKRALLGDLFRGVEEEVKNAAPEPLQEAASVTKKHIVRPVAGWFSALYSRLTGRG